MEPPRGVIAIGHGLAPATTATWMEKAQSAHGWTFRRPAVRRQAEALQVLRQLCESKHWLAVHGRSDWALASTADAVIAGVESLPVRVLRERLSQHAQRQGEAELLLGASIHDELEAKGASRCSFHVFGPVWDTPSKRGVFEPRGVERLRAQSHSFAKVYAVGGVSTPEQVEACFDAGAHGVLVLRAAHDAQQLPELVAAWDGREASRVQS